jgi:hypothetical protein
LQALQIKLAGKKEGQDREDNLGSRVVKDLTRTITDKGHHVYMDNFCSNPTLFEELANEVIFKGFPASRILHSNLVCPIHPKHKFGICCSNTWA